MSPVLLYALLQALSLSQGFNITDDLSPQNVTQRDDQPAIELSMLHMSHGCSGVLRAHLTNITVDVTLNKLDDQEQKDLANQICQNLGCGQAHAVNAAVCSGDCLAGCILKQSTLHNCITAAEDDCTNATEVICEHQVVRLVGGGDGCAGRVELLYTGRWGTVCDDDFDDRSGHVVCAQLGCGSLKTLGVFGAGSGPIHISQMKCNGTERNLWECGVNSTHPLDYCGHKEDAGIVCSESTELTPTTSNTTDVPPMTTAAVVAAAHSGGVSPAAIGCCILSVILLLFIVLNAAGFVHFRRRKACEIQQQRGDEQTHSEQQFNAAVGIYSFQPLPAADAQPYECLGPRANSNYGCRSDRRSSHSSDEMDYEQHHSGRVQKLHVNTSPDEPTTFISTAVHVDDSSSTSSGEGYENANTDTIHKSGDLDKSILTPLAYGGPELPATHSQAVYLSDSSSTSSGEFYTNTKSGMDKVLQSGEKASLQEETPLIPLSHSDQHLPATDSHAVNVNDADSTSSGDYQNIEIDMDNDLQPAVNLNDADSTSSGEDYQNTEIDMDNDLQSDEERRSHPEKSHQTPNDTQTGNTQAGYSATHRQDLDDSGSTSSEDYQNTEILDDFQSGKESPALPETSVQTPLNHHSTQVTGSEDHHVPRNLSQETDNSSTSSENSYVNVPPRSEQDERRSPAEDHAQFSSGSDYDEPENW